jgi:TetR/AcrR family transcriptional regulator, transcriptional repressor for nem operon
MMVFWKQGYFATNMEHLVAATGVSRGGIYTDFGGKEALFIASLEAYRAQIAGPAIERLLAAEAAPGAGEAPRGFPAIEAYFDYFLERLEKYGLPGPGCFCGNVMAELSTHPNAAQRIVVEHIQTLRQGFLKALEVEARARSMSEAADLTGFKNTLMALLRTHFDARTPASPERVKGTPS